MRRFGILSIVLCSLGFTLSTTQAIEITSQDVILTPVKAEISPVIDGVIEKPAWKDIFINEDLITFQPRYGETFPLKTDIFMTYDDENVYFAFYCHDSEPEKIKTSITNRDNMFDDDFVAVSFDALGNSQRAYLFCVNPSGIQGDILDTGGNGNDASSDWVWESAGKIDDNGYQIEIRVPLSSIQYSVSPDKPMRMAFVRKIHRLNTMGSWPEMKPSDNLLTMQAPILIKNLKSVKKIEVLPNVTYNNSSEQTGYNSFDNNALKDIGGDIKLSLNSSVTLDATVNPDFSQVEADAFQVDVNRRYPVFYSEKRPYFMEINSLFNVAGNGNGNVMRTAVHTRRIADPKWSTKVSGTQGKTLFGILVAEDAWSDPDAATLGNPHFLIARGKHSLGDGSYIGGIYTGRDTQSDYNHVAGVDGVYRFRDVHQLDFSVLQSLTRVANKEAINGGNSSSINYQYSTKPLSISTTFENMTDDFRMDTAFYNRTGITHVGTYISPKLYPKIERLSWIERISTSASLNYFKEHRNNAEDMNLNLGINLNFTRNSWFRLSSSRNREEWEGKEFLMTRGHVGGGMQPLKWLNYNGWYNYGKSIYYSDDPFLGNSLDYGAFIKFEPGEKFKQTVSFNHAEMTNPSGGEMMYDVNIVNTRSTYQFNKYFFLRGIYQCNTENNRQLVDLLASFTLIPGTVVQLGYGTLMEEGRWDDNEWRNDIKNLQVLKQSLFFKTSYRYVF
jgi:hypothetical protein